MPADLATIYDLNPLFSEGISGEGQIIAVVEDSDVLILEMRFVRGVASHLLVVRALQPEAAVPEIGIPFEAPSVFRPPSPAEASANSNRRRLAARITVSTQVPSPS